MGITVYINGSWYWFESDEKLEKALDENCNDAGYDSDVSLHIEYG